MLCIAMLVSLPTTALADAPAAPSVPLDGKIWDVGAHRFIDAQSLIRALDGATFVLLGEIHDNREHHAHQAEILGALLQTGRRPAVAFEQFDREYQSDIDAAIARGDAPDALADTAHFDRKGWRWENYQPLVALALDAHVPIVAANFSRTEARTVAAKGFAASTPDKARLGLDRAWSRTRNDALLDSLVAGHCGALTRDDVAPIALAQRARDAVMADALLAQQQRGVVLIAGAGHARRDLGVPLYLHARAPKARIVSIAFTETTVDAKRASDYVDAPVGASRVYDYLWFTAGAERADPCAGFSAARMKPGASAPDPGMTGAAPDAAPINGGATPR